MHQRRAYVINSVAERSMAAQEETIYHIIKQATISQSNIIILIRNLWALTVVNFSAEEEFGASIGTYLAISPLLTQFLKYILQLHFRLFFFGFS
jgi:hypothetical protein